MKNLILLVVCVFFTLTTFSQVHQPYWLKNFQRAPSGSYFDSSSPIRIYTDVIYEIEFKDDVYNRFGADLIVTHQAGSDFNIGVGVGIREYDRINESVIPIFLDVRRSFFEYSYIRPYIEIKAGYGIKAEDVFFEPSMGFIFGDLFYIGVGVSVQKFREEEINSSAGMFKIGLKL
jgi:hypothetical protein